jgi:predicted nucleic-acid-binding Zn-ribbon protein
MKLDDEKRKILEEKFKEYKPQLVCPICGNKDWGVNDTIFELREFNGGDMVIGARQMQTVYPVITLSCTKCGYTHFINVIRLGLIEKSEDKGENNG